MLQGNLKLQPKLVSINVHILKNSDKWAYCVIACFELVAFCGKILHVFIRMICSNPLNMYMVYSTDSSNLFSYAVSD